MACTSTDYFYPYKEKDRRGNDIDFPDAGSYRRYRNSGGMLSKDDWRRENVDSLIHQVYVRIKGIKPWVKFGDQSIRDLASGISASDGRALRFVRRALRRLEKVDPEWLGGLFHAATLLADFSILR